MNTTSLPNELHNSVNIIHEIPAILCNKSISENRFPRMSQDESTTVNDLHSTIFLEIIRALLCVLYLFLWRSLCTTMPPSRLAEPGIESAPPAADASRSSRPRRQRRSSATQWRVIARLPLNGVVASARRQWRLSVSVSGGAGASIERRVGGGPLSCWTGGRAR